MSTVRKGLGLKVLRGGRQETLQTMEKGESISQGARESRTSMFPVAEVTQGLTEAISWHRGLSTTDLEHRTESGVQSPGQQLSFKRLFWKNRMMVLAHFFLRMRKTLLYEC